MARFRVDGRGDDRRKAGLLAGVLEKGVNRWAVGFGMIPRGEVGLIFASIGAALVLGGERIIDATTYSAARGM